MALSRKPKKEKPVVIKDDKVTELILKGGSSPDKLARKSTEPEDDIKFVQLRIPVGQLNDIDILVKKRPGKLSRHTWIMEAIFEKIKRDEE